MVLVILRWEEALDQSCACLPSLLSVRGSAKLIWIPGSHFVHLYYVKMFFMNSLMYK